MFSRISAWFDRNGWPLEVVGPIFVALIVVPALAFLVS